ncbi:hypothetical protein [Actinomadura sp. WMMB 499]|uniref:hypothetical protein n=1 Tax=Actinomadura sp. WMMB 499 TaxID=1219491 RepID=UPI001244A7E5|nr:hypothetical protein [Actinomadura sp. WMMB 499]QFG25418.1 hypothetical protein F7P10_33940 [Actinomadura sp. WMMB 499]
MSLAYADYFTTGPGKPLAHKGTGSRSKRIERIRKAMPFVDDLMSLSNEMDGTPWTQRRGYTAEDEMWVPLPISHNDREDDPRADSNYYTAAELLEDAAAFGTNFRMDAWPGGVIHTLMVRADDALALREAERIVSALQDSPVLDDEDLSRREWEANHPALGECYAEDGCECEYAQHREMSEEDGGHVEWLSRQTSHPEYDGDGDYYCEICSDWFTFTDAEKEYIANGVGEARLREIYALLEGKGQARLF